MDQRDLVLIFPLNLSSFSEIGYHPMAQALLDLVTDFVSDLLGL